jgi:anti-sigma regulatory factor (Ser/Thr protein kinase)
LSEREAKECLDLTLPRRAIGVRTGRDALIGLRAELGLQSHEDARLLVSELLTNAVVHGAGEQMRLRVSAEDGEYLFEVSDDGPGFAPPPPARDRRGLVLVDRIATAWGVDDGPGTHVWFRLPTGP